MLTCTSGGQSNAKSLAKLAAVMANRGSRFGVTLMSEESWEKAHAEYPPTTDEVIAYNGKLPMTKAGFGADLPSYMFERTDHVLTSTGKWFGWGGASGATMMWNPERDMAIALRTTCMAFDAPGGPREWKIVESFLRAYHQQLETAA